MSALSDTLKIGPGTAFSAPVIGCEIPLIITPNDLSFAGAIVSGGKTFGIRMPFNGRVMALTLAADAYPAATAGTNTIALYKHTDVSGGEGGTAILAATSMNAAVAVEGAGLSTVAGAREFTKGQYLVFDPVVNTGKTLLNVVICLVVVTLDYAVADKSAF